MYPSIAHASVKMRVQNLSKIQVNIFNGLWFHFAQLLPKSPTETAPAIERQHQLRPQSPCLSLDWHAQSDFSPSRAAQQWDMSPMQGLQRPRGHLLPRAPAVPVDDLHLQDGVGVLQLHCSGCLLHARQQRSILQHQGTTAHIHIFTAHFISSIWCHEVKPAIWPGTFHTHFCIVSMCISKTT